MEDRRLERIRTVLRRDGAQDREGPSREEGTAWLRMPTDKEYNPALESLIRYSRGASGKARISIRRAKEPTRRETDEKVMRLLIFASREYRN